MKVLLLITISILILQVNCISSRKLLLQASYVSGFDDRYQPSDAVGTYDSYSLFECVKTCSRNIKCNFFFFNKGDNKCMLHSLPFWNTLPSTYQKGWKSYRAESSKLLYVMLLLSQKTARECICSVKSGYHSN